jgi:(1->4)-alpha-D-glucan 1-alpha-D-glucosylmutase
MEMLLYQTLVGAWPFSASEVPEFKERLKSYMVKAAREAKAFTDWLSPNTEYENALISFLGSVLDDSDQNEFLVGLLRFQRQVAYYGALSSLAQVMLKATSPGVPDFYQGSELWDLSLVDPDNRRPVDFQKRIGLLDDLLKQEAKGHSSLAQQLLSSWEDGRVKLYVIHKALSTRKAYQDLFLEGDYIPLQVQGERQEHVCAFARRRGRSWALVAVPRLVTSLVSVGELPLGQQVWCDDSLALPEGAPGRWADVFTGEILQASPKAKVLPLSRIFSLFTVSLLMGTASYTGSDEKAGTPA